MRDGILMDETRTFGLLLLVLALTAAARTAASQPVYFVQGEPGNRGALCDHDSCDLGWDLVIPGGIHASGGATFHGDVHVRANARLSSAIVDVAEVDETITLPVCPGGVSECSTHYDCPSGYSLDPDETDLVLCTRGRIGETLDEMVKVGDLWVDRYEASVWSNEECTGISYGSSSDDWESAAGFPENGQLSRPLYACSVAGVTPSRWLTWFQAAAACAASGKLLLTSSEWILAAAGTPDTAASTGEDGRCLTLGVAVRATGIDAIDEESCVSAWGAEDLIGNIGEWTADWHGLGDGGLVVQSTAYLEDATWNVNAAELQADGSNFPPAALQGGNMEDGSGAGVFALDLRHAPSVSGELFGFRCARTR